MCWYLSTVQYGTFGALGGLQLGQRGGDGLGLLDGPQRRLLLRRGGCRRLRRTTGSSGSSGTARRSAAAAVLLLAVLDTQ